MKLPYAKQCNSCGKTHAKGSTVTVLNGCTALPDGSVFYYFDCECKSTLVFKI